MGMGFATLLAHRVELLMLLQSFAGTADPDVQDMMKARFTELFDQVGRLSGADELAVKEFMAQGMLLTVLAACDLPQVLGISSWEDFPEYCRPGNAPRP
jgi:hypothetical protein